MITLIIKNLAKNKHYILAYYIFISLKKIEKKFIFRNATENNIFFKYIYHLEHIR